ncbi:MAG: bifunctional UDP-N-acetylmuramoyl-tripeptide:D-alanyl-D-alanine ligase/alanine racemase [Prevotellaceae bacterium]|nr:bifunctional UDP-N-acetylmuramoyl-tripeptide:D-alanyl-D-alanine ligase/alanine racemase [Candidatus Faecinaster equi]
MNINHIAELTDAKVFGKGDTDIEQLLNDSRSLLYPETSLFFAIKTNTGNGHAYIEKLYERGVRNFVVSDMSEISIHDDAVYLCVENTLEALQCVAEDCRKQFDIPVIGITGSNGKTIVKDWLAQLLDKLYQVTRSPKSYNSQVGVPLSVWLLNEKSELGIFEAGISQPDEMQRIERVIKPEIGVITNLHSAHQENFSSMAQKCDEKLKLFAHSKVVIYNCDDELIKEGVAKLNVELFGWSKTNPSAKLYIRNVCITDNNSTISYVYQNKEHKYVIPFIDDASIENSITCLAVCLYLDVDYDTINESMQKLRPIAMRLEVKEGRNGNNIINDTYNSDIQSLLIALDFMSRRRRPDGMTTTLVLSDILFSGELEAELYDRIADATTKYHIRKIIGVGEAMMQNIYRFTDIPCKFCFPTTDKLLESGVLDSLKNELILIKGSRKYSLEVVAHNLEKKVHETVLEVNLNAVAANLNHYRSFMKPETKMVCMVKASAYGAGAVEISKTLQDYNVDYLAVAVADEGVTLRHNGINGNIIIMNPEMTAFKDLFDYELQPEVYNFRLLDALIENANREGITQFPIHIKLDTGMHRLGFNPNTDIDKLIERLKNQNAVKPVSIFSHFVGSDGVEFNDFTHQQFRVFDEASRKIQNAFSHRILRHICNSAGIKRFPQYHLDMVRLGLGLYGIDPFDNSIINNVSTLKTTILQIRDVAEGDTVGYSRRGEIVRPSRIAAIPIGYADGLNRRLGRGECYCLVNGMKAPYVGNICMDVCMIDVTDIDCKEGDKVEIFGDNLPVTILSDKLGTIPYEVLTSVSTRVKRVYFQD